jgi:hypothetical protein
MRGIEDMNVLLDNAIAPGSRLVKVRDQALAAMEEVKSTGHFGGEAFYLYMNMTAKFNRPGPEPNMTYERAANIIFSSLYFHAIYTWDQVMTPTNLLIIEAERISIWRSAEKLAKKNSSVSMLRYTGFTMTKTLEEEVADVFRYLGLQPLTSLPRLFVHNSNANIPREHHVDKAHKEQLREFFEPFNQLLKIYLHQRDPKAYGQLT